MYGEKLKPCPFCGCEDTMRVAFDGDDDYAQLRCDKCLAMGPLKDEIGDWQRPCKSWDTRALTAPQSAASELLEALEGVDAAYSMGLLTIAGGCFDRDGIRALMGAASASIAKAKGG